MPISVFSVADAILYEAKLKGINIDPLKLQKLLYHVQYHHIATTGESAFIEPVEAWEKGPAIRVIFKQFQYLGFAFITTLVPIRPILPSTVNSGIEKAVTKFGHLDSSDFAEITHYDLAYIKAWYLGQNTPLKRFFRFLSGSLTQGGPGAC